jgi:uncharacterized protein YecE (DUF72 family)
MAAERAKIWIGPAGWSYQDWHGVVYPQRKPRGFKPLAYLARYFNCIEVNSSFYRILPARTTASWVPQTLADFRFTFKLTQSFTHERQQFPPASDVRDFKEALRPIREAGKLGPVLMQFPWSFRYSQEALDWLARLAESFSELERFIEVRHRSWCEPQALEEVARLGGMCNIDQPQFRECLGPTDYVSGREAYVRLHGRNFKAWFAKDVPRYERYNYLYTEEELAEWVGRLDRMAERARNVYVIANNHYRGQAPANALEIRALLEGRQVDVPPDLLAAYPRLARIARQTAGPGLFDLTPR